jgi:hypothetical protein
MGADGSQLFRFGIPPLLNEGSDFLQDELGAQERSCPDRQKNPDSTDSNRKVIHTATFSFVPCFVSCFVSV